MRHKAAQEVGVACNVFFSVAIYVLVGFLCSLMVFTGFSPLLHAFQCYSRAEIPLGVSLFWCRLPMGHSYFRLECFLPRTRLAACFLICPPSAHVPPRVSSHISLNAFLHITPHMPPPLAAAALS